MLVHISVSFHAAGSFRAITCKEFFCLTVIADGQVKHIELCTRAEIQRARQDQIDYWTDRAPGVDQVTADGIPEVA